MPTANANSAFLEAVALEATWIGAALPRGAGKARVHSVYRSAINFALEGSDCLAALTWRAGEGLPNAIAITAGPDSRVRSDFRTWALGEGATGFLDELSLALESREAGLRVDLRRARRGAREALPVVSRLGRAHRCAVAALSRIQAELDCDLRIDVLLDDGSAPTPMGRRLAWAARAIGEAALGDLPAVAVGGILGLGCGLTPSGDDFLCGFLCGALCAAGGHGALHGISPAAALGEAMERGIEATGEISASLLRCAARGYFPLDLHRAAEAIATEDEVAAAEAIGRLCGIGHSSGADTATGFLYGLAVLTAPETFPRLSRR